ncbi:uncharacterized protein LOC118749730 [Rhagoletis pomonella]|uniref:uncharacterized protein LOC118749730 n=1 Tax=Rhagoletis pomonella TaxID=28610 RepID=UPI00177D52D1|nr:uncharacterized protein LOC118749730 [Rhagoletis pomonella]
MTLASLFQQNRTHLITIDTSLHSTKKILNTREAYVQSFLQIINDTDQQLIIFTDGSVTCDTPSYAVVAQERGGQFRVVHQALLPMHASIFCTELTAIKYAISFASLDKKAIICSDSLSANKSNEAHSFVSEDTLKQPIKLLWVPGHTGIVGNERADQAAKECFKFPLIPEVPCHASIILRTTKALQIEAATSRDNYNTKLSRSQCIKLARLRTGTALFNTAHIFTRTQPPSCSFCATTLTIEHILTVCPNSKINKSIKNILDCNNSNIEVIEKALEIHHLNNQI